jgi:hypothetical protein
MAVSFVFGKVFPERPPGLVFARFPEQSGFNLFAKGLILEKFHDYQPARFVAQGGQGGYKHVGGGLVRFFIFFSQGHLNMKFIIIKNATQVFKKN